MLTEYYTYDGLSMLQSFEVNIFTPVCLYVV